MSDFGDDTPEDAVDPEGVVAPEQVAYRLHELRAYVDALAGEDLIRWEDLTPEEQELGLGVGDVLVRFLATIEPDRAEDAARHLHNVRRFWASSRLPPWEQVPEDERAVGVALMGAILDWLTREGTQA